MKKLREIGLNPSQKPFRILSLDGGGVRGLIPLRILSEIEEKTGKPIAELFDLIVGNSTGGIIALCLAARGEMGRPKYTAKDAMQFYYTGSPQIFHKSWLRPLTTGFGLWAPKYDRSHLDSLLQNFFPNQMRLSEVACPVVVVSYSLTKDGLSIWTSQRAEQDPSSNILMADAAGATSAAPTYFCPKEIRFPNGKTTYEADGGIFANDPEEIAVIEALLQNPNLRPEQIFMLSLGTGQPKLKKTVKQRLGNAGILGWLLRANLIDLMLNADTQLEEFQTASTSFYERYRIQFTIDLKHSAMDNANQGNLDSLLQVGEEFIKNSPAEIDHVCTFLSQKPKST